MGANKKRSNAAWIALLLGVVAVAGMVVRPLIEVLLSEWDRKSTLKRDR